MGRGMVSAIFDSERWSAVEGFDFTDITYHRAREHGTVRVAINRPEVRNAFRPHTVDELYRALDHARMWTEVGRSAPEAISEFAARTATSTKAAAASIRRVSGGFTSSKCSGSFASCRRSSLPSFRAGR